MLLNTTQVANASTATLTSAAVTPLNTTAGRFPSKIALQVTVSATSGSPSLIFKLQGSVDNQNYVDVLLLPSDTDTAAASFTKSGAPATFVYHVAQAQSRQFTSYKFVSTTVTTTTYSAWINEIQ